MPQIPSTRWSPTPEQLMILEEMYRCGVRTPNASQIQHITSHLSNYGKIEGKNVFYWFQNHKARERQKLRRRLSKQHQLPLLLPISQLPLPNHDSSQLLHGMHTHYLQFTGGGFPEQRSQGMDLLKGIDEDGGNRAEASFPLNAGRPFRWGCKPPKTLELFPTTRSGFKDECSTSKSSTSSPSTN